MKDGKKPTITRRQSIGLIAGGASFLATQPILTLPAQEADGQLIALDPVPRFELSPYLYMQFMEPLGATDASVEAAWDHLREDWREDVVETARELAPTMLRWGGIFLDFYRWREGVGPRDKRPPMLNLLWGGIESNQVGTAEFVDFSRRVGAEPLICVNFESDGRKQYMKAKGSVRTADAREAADWVRYCNDPADAERRAHGRVAPHAVKYWQIGNETSYDKNGFDLETAARKTVEFAAAMRKADPTLQLIAWGDSGWAARMIEVAGEHAQMLAFHHMFNPDDDKQPVLRGELYRRDAEATWRQLMKAWEINDRKIRTMRESLGRSRMPLAMTECHFTVPGRDRGDVNSTWATGVAYARILNNHQRHGDLLKIATAADFCGTRWQNNAVIIPVPKNQGRAYLQPVARVMRLYRHHTGSHAVEVKRTPDGLDIVASRSGDTVYLHVVNTQRTRAVKASFQIEGRRVQSGRVLEMADDPMVEVTYLNSAEVMRVVEKPIGDRAGWEFPAASVSAVELKLTQR
ncbi:MAG TPA: alpha-L-arabinofuranosidase C-terminal domain-containing protein [Blastocatellia bacterium]|nr:alpha-L-arabinofuranosidase C-terminal domain-containing protein [Blastocatellia bacterium]